MSQPHTPEQRNPGIIIPLQNLQDLALDDSEHSFYAPRGGDWAILGLVVATLLGTGLFSWHQLEVQSASAGGHAGRAIFFGFLLVCVYWAAILYAFKLSVGIRVGPSGMSVVRGPWHTELAWRETARLVERTQIVEGQRLRWVIALARDGRRLQIREDMVDDYVRFRMEIYERYRLWRDHGGTWGTTGAGPFQARETVSTQVTWWGVVAGLLILPGLYFLILLPETGALGPALLLAGIVCALLSLRALVRRQTYHVDAKAIEASRLLGRTIRLPWREVARADRSRHPFNGAIQGFIAAGRFALKLSMRNDKRMRSFDWYPRVPEYLTLRGAGHQIRINLHRLARPDELLAWVEFYERVGKRVSAAENVRRKSTSPRAARVPEVVLPETALPETALFAERSASGIPLDPWSDDLAGVPTEYLPGQMRAGWVPPASAAAEKADAWLRDEEDILDDTVSSEEAPTQEVPAAAFQAYFNNDAPDDHTLKKLLDDLDNLEDMPTAEMEAASKAGRVTPPLGNKTSVIDENSGAQIPSPHQTFAVPVSHSLDQLWAPATQDVPLLPGQGPSSEEELFKGEEQKMAGIQRDEEESEEANGPAQTVDGLGDLFAPRRAADTSWQPPILPRYGPPLASSTNENEPERHRDGSMFSEDDFLR
ncbi:MAG: hypothetical protein ACLQUY_07630 [Ktedonobacterales bacterium]